MSQLHIRSEATFLWLNHEHGIFGSSAKKKEIEVAWRSLCGVGFFACNYNVHACVYIIYIYEAWAMSNANTVRARLVYIIRLFRKTPKRSKCFTCIYKAHAHS